LVAVAFLGGLILGVAVICLLLLLLLLLLLRIVVWSVGVAHVDGGGKPWR